MLGKKPNLLQGGFGRFWRVPSNVIHQNLIGTRTTDDIMILVCRGKKYIVITQSTTPASKGNQELVEFIEVHEVRPTATVFRFRKHLIKTVESQCHFPSPNNYNYYQCHFIKHLHAQAQTTEITYINNVLHVGGVKDKDC